MNKKWIYIKRIISIILFFVIVASLYWYVDRTMKLKRTDGITPMQNYYLQPEGQIDVLLLGSSHAGMNFDTEAMWTSHGISAYALWGSVQPFYNSYYFLKEAVDTNKPKIVVLDTYAATFQAEYSDYSRQVTNIVGMKHNYNRFEAIKVSTTPDRWAYLMLGLPCYHTRYAELSENDFSQYPWSEENVNIKGTSYRYGVGKGEYADVSDITETKEINAKQKEYLLKIIELCKDEKIELLLVKSPTVARASMQGYFNSVQKIADDNGLEFINYNLIDDKVGLTENDISSDGSHLNTGGTRKISDYLAGYLKEKYNLADHRDDEAYKSWEDNATNIQNGYMRIITRYDDYLNELCRNDRSVAVVKYDNTEANSDLFSVIANSSGEYSFISDSDNQIGVWINESTHSGKYEKSGDFSAEKSVQWKSAEISFNPDKGIKVIKEGKDVCEVNEDCVMFFVYDNDTGKIEDIALCTSADGVSAITVKHFK